MGNLNNVTYVIYLARTSMNECDSQQIRQVQLNGQYISLKINIKEKFESHIKN